MIGYIYKITNIKTNQSYIGQTIDINRRKRTHFNTLKNNKHDNPKLQASWNKYGEDNFTFEYWEFLNINEDILNQLECDYIEKYNGLSEGFNLVPGGGKPPLHQKVKDDDIATFLCIQRKLGDGYGKSCEEIFKWAKGTASSAKRKIRYLKGWKIFEQLSDEEKEQRAQDFIDSQKLLEVSFKRQLLQKGCEKAYQLSNEDFYFAFAAKELKYGYSCTALYLGIKPATVKDWFNGRSRKKEKEQYDNLSPEEKQRYIDKVNNSNIDELQNFREQQLRQQAIGHA